MLVDKQTYSENISKVLLTEKITNTKHLKFSFNFLFLFECYKTALTPELFHKNLTVSFAFALKFKCVNLSN